MKLTKRGQNVVLVLMILMGGLIGFTVDSGWWNEVSYEEQVGFPGGAVGEMKRCMMEC